MSSSETPHFYNEEISLIDKIEFCVFKNEEVERYSAVKKDLYGINIPETYDNNEAKKGGLADPRLGTNVSYVDCATCGLDPLECQGHPGHTKLAEPVFHVGYLNYVKNILSCICLRCSKLRIYKNEDEIMEMLKGLEGKNRFAEIKKLTHNVTYCQRQDYNCGVPLPKIKIEIKKFNATIQMVAETNLTILQAPEAKTIAEGKKKLREILTPENCYDILRNISDTDCLIMGIDPAKTRPEDLIIKTFPIPPVAVRPSVKLDFLASSSAEDTMTHKLADIIKSNIRIRKQKDRDELIGNESKYGFDNRQLLQYHIATYFDNESLTLPRSEQKAGGRPSKSVSERLKGKPGRIRGNLMAKRVNFSGRTVITSDPNIGIDQLGVPLKIAENLTFPEIVTPHNIERLTKLVMNGRDTYPGANFIFRNNMTGTNRQIIVDLRYRKKTIKLRYGDTVERHLVDDDYVIFNRQPSLHKLSMMGHRIMVIKDDRYSTFRLNVNATAPYNADFDGDEMNIFVPQTIQTRIECAMIADVKRQIITPRTSKPIISFVQDTVLGSYLMTGNNNPIDWRDAMNLTMHIPEMDHRLITKNREYSGKELYSHLLPKEINLSMGKELKIVNGKVETGALDKRLLKTVIATSWNKYGSMESTQFINNAQRFIANWLLMRGFTVGIGDILDEHPVLDQIMEMNMKKILEIDHLITEMENNPELMDAETFEKTIQEDLATIKGQIGKMVMEALDDENNFYVMANSKSKGSPINVGQVIGGLGQDIFLFKRIPKRVNNRSLVHYCQNDDSALARGFIQHSYYHGLTPQEFFFHHMAGREGLIDTAIKTADTGYISRKLIKALEDVMVAYDGTLRNGINTIVQYLYGDSHVDQTMQKSQRIAMVDYGNKKMKEVFMFSDKEMKDISKKTKLDMKVLKKMNQKFYEQIKFLRDELRMIQRLARINYITLENKYMLPIDLNSIISDNSLKEFSKSSPLNPMYVLEQLENLLSPNLMPLVHMTQAQKQDGSYLKMRDEMEFKYLIRTALFEYLAPKRCIVEYGLSREQFDSLVENVGRNYRKALIQPGEMVGCVAAQSMGEPATQMTLNTFHQTGTGVVGMQGVPRMREIISVTKEIKTPAMIIYLDEDHRENSEIAHRISSYIKHTTLSEITDDIEVIYDPDPFADEGYAKMDKVTNLFVAGMTEEQGKKVNIQQLPWLIRAKLRRELMIERDVTLLDVKTKFVSYWNKRYADLKGLKKDEKKIVQKIARIGVMSNYDVSQTPTIHIRVSMHDFDLQTFVQLQDLIFNQFMIKGINNISGIDKVSPQRMIHFDNQNEEQENIQEHVIYANGVNLKDIRLIRGIDLYRTITNDIYQVYLTFGIEAARSIILKELGHVYNDSGNDVNYHHLSLIVDVMTNTGKLTSIDRHGLNKLATDPLPRASFEKTIDQFITAAVFGETDHMRAVASRIMAGQVIGGGTGLCDIIMDNDLLENTEYTEVQKLDGVKTFKALQTNSLIDDILGKTTEDIYVP